MTTGLVCAECGDAMHVGEYYVRLRPEEQLTVCLECASHMGWIAHGQPILVAGYEEGENLDTLMAGVAWCMAVALGIAGDTHGTLLAMILAVTLEGRGKR